MAELREVVAAMRALASQRVQEAQRALPGVRRYARSTLDAIEAALALDGAALTGPAAPGRRALVLCMAEHGFVGGFNERLLRAAEARLQPGDALFVLGSRGALMLREHRRAPAWAGAMATHLDSVPDLAHRLATALYRRIAVGDVTRADVVFARERMGAVAEIVHRRLFPLEPPAADRRPLPPLHNLPTPALLEQLAAAHIFALLTEAATESYAAENTARFAAMTAAHDNVSRRLDQLRQDAALARQAEVTDELIDLVTGAEALATAERPAGAQSAA